MKITVKPLLLLVISCCLVGCATSARVAEMYVESPAVIAHKGDELFQAIQVGSVSGGQEDMFTFKVNNDDFKSALEQTLNNCSYLSVDDACKYMLAAEIVKQTDPSWGFTTEVSLTVLYSLRYASGKTVFEDSIQTMGSKGTDDSLSATTRAQYATEESFQLNLAALIERLSDTSM